MAGQGRRLHPSVRLDEILLYFDAVRKQQFDGLFRCDFIAGLGMTEPVGDAQPNAAAGEVDQRELKLRIGVALLCGKLVPGGCIGRTGNDAFTARVKLADPEMRFGVAL